MKKAALIPVWGRHSALAYFEKHIPADVQVFAICSTPSDAGVCLRYGYTVFEYPNGDLAAKLQYGLEQTSQFDFDFICMMGSDDCISGHGWRRIEAEFETGADIVAFADCVFYDTRKRRYFLWPGYPEGHHRAAEPVGAGRCYTRAFLDSLDFKLWAGKKEGGVDLLSWGKTSQAQVSILKCDGDVWICDIKDAGSRNPVAAFPYIQPCPERIRVWV